MKPRAIASRPAALRGDVSVLAHVGPVDDLREEREGRIVAELVVLDQDLEGAEAVAVGVGRTRRVEARRTLAGSVVEHLVAGHVDDLRVMVDELPDQPWTGDAIGMGVLADCRSRAIGSWITEGAA